MKLSDFIDGLLIIQKYEKDQYCMQAEHDEMFISSIDLPMSEEDEAQMLKLGWRKDDYSDSWHVFV
jgi:hypothetical protein